MLERARAAGVALALTIGSGEGPPDLEVGIRLAEEIPWVYATVGVHPHEASKGEAAALERLEELCGRPKVLAVGEIGLDYHYDHSPREVQREVFAAQLRIAHRVGKPVVIHTREAWADTVALLRQHCDGPGIMHCFSGGWAEAQEALELGFYLSFAGILTFPKAEPLRETAARAPLERLLVETDAPYLAPAPHRGKRNEPAFVAHTLETLARVRGLSIAEADAVTTANFSRLFGLRVPLPTGTLEP